jgi:hypothetical protein
MSPACLPCLPALPACPGCLPERSALSACLPAARWIGFRLDLLVALLMTAAPLLMMAVHDQVRSEARPLMCSPFAVGRWMGLASWLLADSISSEGCLSAPSSA